MAKIVLRALIARLRSLMLATAASGLAVTASAQSDSESMAWDAARQAGTFEAYQSYLQNYPTGMHADEAFKTMIELAASSGSEVGPVRGVNATLY